MPDKKKIQNPIERAAEMAGAIQDHVTKELTTYEFHLPTMPDDEYKKTMDSLVAIMSRAFIAGYDFCEKR